MILAWLVSLFLSGALAAPARAQEPVRARASAVRGRGQPIRRVLTSRARGPATAPSRPSRRQRTLRSRLSTRLARARRRLEGASRYATRPIERAVAKNRGALATLDGLNVGQRITLVDPTTGYPDPKAEITEVGIDPWSKVPYAYVRFSNRGEIRYAAERLQLVGKPLAYQRRYLAESRAKLLGAVEAFAGRSAQGVRIMSLRGRNWGPRHRQRKHGPRLGPFLKALNEELAPGDGVAGFERNKTVFLSRHLGAFDEPTAVHELIHAMSEPFVRQAEDRDFIGLMEGLTEYFTFRIATPFYGAEPNPNHAYSEYRRFAEHVCKTIGEARVKKLFFSDASRSLTTLARLYDRAAKQPAGTFYRRVNALEDGAITFDAKEQPVIDAAP